MPSQKLIKNIEIFLLSLMILSLPSLEAPKNIFLVFFVLVAIARQLGNPQRLNWDIWDSIFALTLGTALLSTLFAGMPHHGEWKGFNVLVTMIGTGWMVSRGQYGKEELSIFFKAIVLGAIPPLGFGLWQLFVTHAKTDLQLHSVGHVNHSAIYLVMIFGATLGWLLSYDRTSNNLKRLALAALSIGFLTSLIIGQSRGAVGIGFILALMIILAISRGRLVKSLTLSTLLLVAALTLILQTGVVQKQIANEKNNNVLASRDLVWNVSFEAAHFSPLLGIGMSNWGSIKLEDLKASVERRHEVFNPDKYLLSVGHSHNLYLTALVERGLVGLGMTLILMLAWLRHLVKTFRLTRLSPQATYLWAGSLSAWVATFGIGFVNTTFHHEHGILACLLLGLYLSYTRSQETA